MKDLNLKPQIPRNCYLFDASFQYSCLSSHAFFNRLALISNLKSIQSVLQSKYPFQDIRCPSGNFVPYFPLFHGDHGIYAIEGFLGHVVR